MVSEYLPVPFVYQAQWQCTLYISFLGGLVDSRMLLSEIVGFSSIIRKKITMSILSISSRHLRLIANIVSRGIEVTEPKVAGIRERLWTARQTPEGKSQY